MNYLSSRSLILDLRSHLHSTGTFWLSGIVKSSSVPRTQRRRWWWRGPGGGSDLSKMTTTAEWKLASCDLRGHPCLQHAVHGVALHSFNIRPSSSSNSPRCFSPLKVTHLFITCKRLLESCWKFAPRHVAYSNINTHMTLSSDPAESIWTDFGSAAVPHSFQTLQVYSRSVALKWFFFCGCSRIRSVNGCGVKRVTHSSQDSKLLHGAAQVCCTNPLHPADSWRVSWGRQLNLHDREKQLNFQVTPRQDTETCSAEHSDGSMIRVE